MNLWETRTLTSEERERLASGRGVTDLAVTCDGDYGHGPCGTYTEWTDGTCSAGHDIEIRMDAAEIASATRAIGSRGAHVDGCPESDGDQKEHEVGR